MEHVPKYLLRRPDIRARQLILEGRIYPVEDKTWIVAGRTGLYHVRIEFEAYRCDCQCGITGRTCSHVLAVALYNEKEKVKSSGSIR